VELRDFCSEGLAFGPGFLGRSFSRKLKADDFGGNRWKAVQAIGFVTVESDQDQMLSKD